MNQAPKFLFKFEHAKIFTADGLPIRSGWPIVHFLVPQRKHTSLTKWSTLDHMTFHMLVPPASTRSTPLYLHMYNLPIFYLSNFSYSSFAILNHSYSYHRRNIAIISFMVYLFIKHHCTRAETVTLEQEEGEPEPKLVGDDTPIDHKADVPIYLSPYFLSLKYMCLICA